MNIMDDPVVFSVKTKPLSLQRSIFDNLTQIEDSFDRQKIREMNILDLEINKKKLEDEIENYNNEIKTIIKEDSGTNISKENIKKLSKINDILQMYEYKLGFINSIIRKKNNNETGGRKTKKIYKKKKIQRKTQRKNQRKNQRTKKRTQKN
jgi:hypothetical protein